MKKEDIRNKLNEKERSFDKEALWDKIERPQKKKKRPVVWWFFFGGLLLGILSVFTLPNSKQPKSIANQENQDSYVVTQENFNPEKKHVVKKNESEIGKEAKKVITSSYTSSPLETPWTTSKIIHQKTAEETKPSSEKSDYLSQSTVDSLSSSQLLYDSIDDTVKADLTGTRSNPTISIVQSESFISDIKNDIVSETSIALTIDSTQKENTDNDSLITPVNEKPTHVEVTTAPYHPFYIQSFATVGQINPLYSQEYRNIEQPLEVIHFGLMANYQLPNALILSGGLTYSTNSTRIAKNIDDRKLTLGLDSRPILNNSEIEYRLYNTYHNLDLLLGVGYNFSIGPFYLIPKFHLNIPLARSYKGEYFDTNNNLVSLSEDVNYSSGSLFLFRGSTELGYRFSKGWSLGILAHLDTSRELATGIHSIQNNGVGIILSKSF